MCLLENKLFFEVNIYNYTNHKKILDSRLVLFNGFFPDLAEILLNKGKRIYFISTYNLNMAKKYFPNQTKLLHLVESSSKQEVKDKKVKISNIIYEGHVNFFSGIDISLRLISRLKESNNKLNIFIIPHVEPGLRAPVQTTADFDYHLHSPVKSWENFYGRLIGLFDSQCVYSADVFETIDPQSTLIINCSNSYHQSYFKASLEHIQKGASFYGSSRNPYKEYLNNSDLHIFDSSLLRNWSPFHEESYLNSLIECRLLDNLRKRINFV